MQIYLHHSWYVNSTSDDVVATTLINANTHITYKVCDMEIVIDFCPRMEM
jgi:hypothetical protein